MKVLIVTYYWPPAGGPGVQRWLKFVKYLRDFGIEPVVFTAENPSYPILDASLSVDVPEGIEVLKCPIFEPNGILSKLKKDNGQKSMGFLNPNPGPVDKLLRYIRANYFIPDARKFWIKPAVKMLKEYLKEHPVDVLITTGPPYSVHLIGQQVKEAIHCKWIADFRDPWTSVDYFHLLPLTKASLAKHEALEQAVVRSADAVLMVSEHAKKKYEKEAKFIDYITNGFDVDTALEHSDVTLDTKFTITHIGMMNSERNPSILWEVLAELSDEIDGFKEDMILRFVGKIDTTIEREIQDLGIQNLEQISYVPHHEAKLYQRQTQVLLIVVNDYPSAKEMIPGKTFEYLQARRPVIGMAPEDGDLARVIKSTNAGEVFDYSNKKALKHFVTSLYQRFKEEGIPALQNDISKYHRRNLTGDLSAFIQKVIQKH